MSQRESNLLWMRDILEQLITARQQLEWVEDQETLHVVTETMLRDLERCQRLCESLRQRSARARSLTM